jgi:hypothetical protein
MRVFREEWLIGTLHWREDSSFSRIISAFLANNRMACSKIYEERVVMKMAWRTYERERVGGSQRSEGHRYRLG